MGDHPYGNGGRGRSMYPPGSTSFPYPPPPSHSMHPGMSGGHLPPPSVMSGMMGPGNMPMAMGQPYGGMGQSGYGHVPIPSLGLSGGRGRGSKHQPIQMQPNMTAHGYGPTPHPGLLSTHPSHMWGPYSSVSTTPLSHSQGVHPGGHLISMPVSHGSKPSSHGIGMMGLEMALSGPGKRRGQPYTAQQAAAMVAAQHQAAMATAAHHQFAAVAAAGHMKMTKKRLKDPHAPKKASTAFMLWSLSTRPKLCEEYPEMKFAELGKKLGELWKLVDPNEKEHWQRQANRDRERYDREQGAYLKSQEYADWMEHVRLMSGKKRKRRKDPNAPKQPLTAYVLFSNEIRDSILVEHPGLVFGEIGKMIGAKWRNLSPEEKRPFEEKALGDRERYNQEVDYYRRAQNMYYEDGQYEGQEGEQEGHGSSSMQGWKHNEGEDYALNPEEEHMYGEEDEEEAQEYEEYE